MTMSSHDILTRQSSRQTILAPIFAQTLSSCKPAGEPAPARANLAIYARLPQEAFHTWQHPLPRLVLYPVGRALDQLELPIIAEIQAPAR